jgi:arylsulfatase A-like enzyme
MTKSLLLAAAAVISSSAVLAADAPPAAKPLPNIVIFAPDGLRADRLGTFGYARRPTTPAIDAAAKEGLVFENAESQASWTLPSFASLFTSRYPHQHGALWIDTKVAASEPLLAKLLSLRGYKTAGFVGGPFLNPEYGMARGFATYNANGARYFQDTMPLALNWIKENKGSAPFFVFVHGNDVHPPFNPALPKSVRDRFDPSYEGPANDLVLDYYFVRVFNKIELGEGTPPPDDDYKAKVEAIRSDARSIEHIGALYDGQVARVDEAFKSLMDFLKQEGLAQNTIVVLMSDHGLELGERGLLATGYHPTEYETISHVPLILWGPGIAPGRRKDVAQIIDIAPTLLSLTSTPAPAGYLGKILLDSARPADAAMGESTIVGSPVIKEYFMRQNRWKLLLRPGKTETRELYDLSVDPQEKTDLSAKEAGKVRSLSEKLSGLTAAPR